MEPRREVGSQAARKFERTKLNSGSFERWSHTSRCGSTGNGCYNATFGGFFPE